MSRRRTGKPASIEAPIQPPTASRTAPTAADSAPPAAKERKRRRATHAEFEERIGYRFTDPALLEQALTHISALTGARNRAGIYQRLEFLGDHVLGLVVSDMLFRAFPRPTKAKCRAGLPIWCARRHAPMWRGPSILARRSGLARRKPTPAAAAAPRSSPMSAKR